MFKSGVVTTLLDNAAGRKERENSLFAVSLGFAACLWGVFMLCERPFRGLANESQAR